MGHRAGGVRLGHLRELTLGHLVGHVVQERDAAIERRLDTIGLARDREGDVAHVTDHFLDGRGLVFLAFVRQGGDGSGGEHDRRKKGSEGAAPDRFHWVHPPDVIATRS